MGKSVDCAILKVKRYIAKVHISWYQKSNSTYVIDYGKKSEIKFYKELLKVHCSFFGRMKTLAEYSSYFFFYKICL
jgi:hypothetical protein